MRKRIKLYLSNSERLLIVGETLASLTPAGRATHIIHPGGFWRLPRDSNVDAIYLGDTVLTNKELAKEVIINGSLGL